MLEADFLEIVEEILEMESADITLDSLLDDLDWDSLANISLIAVIDAQLGKQIGAQALEDAMTVGDLFALVSA